MNILLIGSGGREHALAWKISQSPHLKRLYTLPGNPGTAQFGTNITAQINDHARIVELTHAHAIDLVIIGPEDPLANGLSDVLRQAGFKVFGPSQAAAQIEASKAFAKAFMQRHSIPTALAQTFDSLEPALSFMEGYPAEKIVIKASGLAAGKGVFLPESDREARAVLTALLSEGYLGEAGNQVIIEERLTGREVSILAFSDGNCLAVMPPVQDHKRLLDNDRGPNTGGMGALAPSPACTHELLDQIEKTILQPAVDGLRSEGMAFTGVLYAGLILTENGPFVLEFNCRFGDPETQALMPLLETDLVEIALACSEGRLEKLASSLRWKPGGTACVVLAAPGYPERTVKGQAISGLDQAQNLTDTWVFQAGVTQKGKQIVVGGGRVAGVTACAPSLTEAIERAYKALPLIQFEGCHYRRDIGSSIRAGKHLAAAAAPAPKQTAYEQAGVSIASGNQAVAAMRAAVRSTYNPQVLSDIGAFGGLFDASPLTTLRQPVLVASTDGVGTKVELGARMGRCQGLGVDLVNHCINDILVQGARPLFFLDYIASSHLEVEAATALVEGISMACREANCALIGGETAEMPGVYQPGCFDLAGTIVGCVERGEILPKKTIAPGDVLIGLASSGPHTNGYSLIRKIFADTALDTVFPGCDRPLIDLLLAPHRSYLPVLEAALFNNRPTPIQALAHITGGGFIDNLPRVLPSGCSARIDTQAWEPPPLFHLIQEKGRVSREEMYHVFNMGIGMVAVVKPQDIAAVRRAIPEETWVIGEVIAGGGVQLH